MAPAAGPAVIAALLLPDAATVADLATYVGRAARADPDGAARLVGHGDVLAVYVSPLHGAGGPTVLGLRTSELAAASDADTTVALAALSERFARLRSDPPGDPGEPVALPLPPAEAARVAWAGIAPPRRGWEAIGLLDSALLGAAAAQGVAEVAQGAPAGSGGQAVARLRASVWGRPLAEAGVPAGVAFAADALGFLIDAEPLALYRCGVWARLTCSRGHVLARPAALA